MKEVRGRHLVVYSDGACRKNGKGACGALVTEDSQVLVALSFALKNTTNNQMEISGAMLGLQAALQLLIDADQDVRRFSVKNSSITVITDSEYTKKGISEWIKNWKKRGWRSASGDPVKNKELWQLFDDLTNAAKKHVHQITFEWVRGHNGNPLNEGADYISTAAIDDEVDFDALVQRVQKHDTERIHSFQTSTLTNFGTAEDISILFEE